MTGPRLFGKYAKGRENMRGVKKNYMVLSLISVLVVGGGIMRVTQAIDAFRFNRARILMKKELNMRVVNNVVFFTIGTGNAKQPE